MILAFDTLRLREICEDEAIARTLLEPNAVELLIERLADLRAAETIFALPVGSPAVTGSQGERLTISLGNRCTMIWIANHSKLPLSEIGTVDWKRVTRIRLLSIGGVKCSQEA